mgnify:CR=1 FL=1
MPRRGSYYLRQSQPNPPSISKVQMSQDVEAFLRGGGKIKQISASDGGERAGKHMWIGHMTKDQKDRQNGQVNHYYGKPAWKY